MSCVVIGRLLTAIDRLRWIRLSVPSDSGGVYACFGSSEGAHVVQEWEEARGHNVEQISVNIRRYGF